MKIIYSIALGFLLTFSVADCANSQGSAFMHLGTAIPMGEFASDDPDDEEAGGAAVGLDAGFQYTYTLTKNGLGFMAGLDVCYNWLQEDVKDDMKAQVEAMGLYGAIHTFYRYLNFPLTIGLVYQYPVAERTTLFLDGGMVVDFLKITNYTLEAAGEKAVTEFGGSNKIGFRIGAGILLSNRTSIEINYFGTGTHEIDARVRADGYTDTIEDLKLKVNFLTLTLGFRLTGPKESQK